MLRSLSRTNSVLDFIINNKKNYLKTRCLSWKADDDLAVGLSVYVEQLTQTPPAL